jgi:hypothetical protein
VGLVGRVDEKSDVTSPQEDYALLMRMTYPDCAIMAFAPLVLAVLATVASAQQPPSPTAAPPNPPLVREGATVKLTDHVWAIPVFNVGLVPNVGIVVGGKATLVVDTGLGP